MNVRRLMRAALSMLALGAVTTGAMLGCSSAEGTGNLLAGQACDAFTIVADPACVCCSNHSGNCVSGVSPCAPKDASPTCGDPCPDGLTCTTVNGAAVCGIEARCDGPTEQSCGNCGVQRRTCESGTWSTWSACEGEGECPPGAVESCGTGQERSCDATCLWGECVAECAPGDAETADCGFCGTETRDCTSAGAWGVWSGCQNEGECSPGATTSCSGGTEICSDTCEWGACLECVPDTTETQGCEYCGTQSRTCDGSGNWGAFAACQSPGSCFPGTTQACASGSEMCLPSCEWGTCAAEVCNPGEVQSQGCASGCGTETRTCQDDGTWGAWSGCQSAGTCTPGGFQACASGYQVCDFKCEWSACIDAACVPGTTAEIACGNCGTGTATCQDTGTWGVPPSCSAQGACTPGTAQGCGVNGVEVCTGGCQWDTCLPIECTSGAADVQPCGLCGTMSRSCVNQRWSAFSSCSGEGVCAPNATGACGSNGTMTCLQNCQWGTCTGQTCSGPFVQSCGICGIQTRTCDNGVWSAFSLCMGERDCIPGQTQACGGGGTQACGLDCYWSACP